jgi:hypothetical protein
VLEFAAKYKRKTNMNLKYVTILSNAKSLSVIRQMVPNMYLYYTPNFIASLYSGSVFSLAINHS